MAKCTKCKKEICNEDLIIETKINKKEKKTYLNYDKVCFMLLLQKRDKRAKTQNAEQLFIKRSLETNKIVTDRKNSYKLNKFLENHYHLKLPRQWFTRDKMKITILENYKADWFLEFMQSDKTQKNLASIRNRRINLGQEEIAGYNLLQYEMAILANKYFYFVRDKMNHIQNVDINKTELQERFMKEAKLNKNKKHEKNITKRDTLDEFLF